jgi:hypothetical protein
MNELALVMSDKGEICEECELEEIQQGRIKALTAPGIAGLVAGALPFFFNFSTSNSQTINGQVVESSHFDFVAVPCGALALLLSVVVGLTALGKGKAKRLPVAAGVLILGLVQLVRGLGIV